MPRRFLFAGSLVVAASLFLTAAREGLAQEVLDWGEFTPCSTCEIVLRERVRLGEAGGEGVIESEWPMLTAAAGRGYLVHGEGLELGRRFHLYDPEGRFVRSVGRAGQGPGEFQGIQRVHFAEGGRIVALDAGGRLMTFREDGGLLSDLRLQGAPPGPFVLEGDVVVVASMGRDPGNAGLPLHVVGRVDGAARAHFGGNGGAQGLLGGLRDEVRLAHRAEGSREVGVWWSRYLTAHLEEWGFDGTHLRTITGEPAWMPSPEENVFPWVAIEGLAVDARDRLWVLSVHPSEGWEEVVPGAVVEGGYGPGQLEELWDSRLDVYDLSTGQHLGHRVWNRPMMQLATKGEDVLLYGVEYETPLWPQVVVYDLEVRQWTPPESPWPASAPGGFWTAKAFRRLLYSVGRARHRGWGRPAMIGGP